MQVSPFLYPINTPRHSYTHPYPIGSVPVSKLGCVMNTHEYMLLADGSVLPFPHGVPTAHQIAYLLIEHRGAAYYWPGTHYLVEGWYVLLPVFEDSGGTRIDYADVPELIKLAIMLT